MPAYTLGEIMSQATFAVGRRSDLEVSRVSFLANEAYLEVAGVAPRALSERTAALSIASGEPTVALPVDCEEPMSLAYTVGSSGTFRRISLEEIDSRSTAAGTPTDVVFFGNHMQVWPSPSSGYSAQLRYRAGVSDLVATSDVPSLSTPWRPAIALKLEEKLHVALGNWQGAAMAQQRYLGLVSQLETDEARRQRFEGARGMRVIYGDAPLDRGSGTTW